MRHSVSVDSAAVEPTRTMAKPVSPLRGQRMAASIRVHPFLLTAAEIRRPAGELLIVATLHGPSWTLHEHCDGIRSRVISKRVVFMHKGKRKHPNALRHGAFSKMAIIPGEDLQEFEELHSALIEEWAPVGPTEEDTVLSIAKGIWRKRRLQKIIEASIRSDMTTNPKHPTYDEAFALQFFYEAIADDSRAFIVLKEITADHFAKKISTARLPN
jgi:hypothetical protein